MRSLPDPCAGGSLEDLRDFVNVSDEEWPLYIAWLVAALRPSGPFTVMLIHGEQGSAKSTAARVARAIVDPNEAPVRREPRDGRDLVVAARNGWVVAYDNVSSLSQWLSDDIARLATGIGFGTRQLYTDTDEVIVNVSRPVVLNGITEVATRGDLLDRGLVLNLPAIKRYVPEERLWAAFRKAHPGILGALLDAAVCALAHVDTVDVEHLRMADFARWVIAAEPALGLAPGEFIRSYESNRASAVQLTLESSPIVPPIRVLGEVGFEGTASELLERLTSLVFDDISRRKGWPGAPHVLAGQLKRLAPALRKTGVAVTFERSASERRISIRTVAESSVTSVTILQEGFRERVVDEAVARGDDADDARDAPPQIDLKDGQGQLFALSRAEKPEGPRA